MKKYLLCALGFISLFLLGACEEDDLFESATTFKDGQRTSWNTRVHDPEPNNPYPLYVFPALQEGLPDFALHLTNAWNFHSEAEFREAPGYSNRLIVAAVYSLACPDCEAHAPYFERLAQEFAHTPLEFVILFMDDNRDAIASLDWVQKINAVPVYYNSDNFCRRGLCTFSSGVMQQWIAHSKVELGGHIGFPSRPEDSKTPEQVYAAYVKKTQEFIEKYIGQELLITD